MISLQPAGSIICSSSSPQLSTPLRRHTRCSSGSSATELPLLWWAFSRINTAADLVNDYLLRKKDTLVRFWVGYHCSQLYAYFQTFPQLECQFWVLFNVGWASLQISHMSLVPALSCSRKRRVVDLGFRISSTTSEIASPSLPIC